jgi:hypothetical protein
MTYPNILFAFCSVGSESYGNSVARETWHKGVLPAFGGDFGIGLCAIGGGPVTHWLAYGVATQESADAVADCASGPLVVACYPRATHEDALDAVLAAHGYEKVP